MAHLLLMELQTQVAVGAAVVAVTSVLVKMVQLVAQVL
jgi:hypothetical protein